jgi:hypothetical protein
LSLVIASSAVADRCQCRAFVHQVSFHEFA